MSLGPDHWIYFTNGTVTRHYAPVGVVKRGLYRVVLTEPVDGGGGSYRRTVFYPASGIDRIEVRSYGPQTTP